ncbi:xanthine dehydrogenase accessory protein XdhC [Calidifontibacter terrae]
MHWIEAISRLREQRVAAVLVTLTDVRGHAPRAAGAKMVVTATDVHGSVGGGNLEETAVQVARAMLADGDQATTQRRFSLSEHAAADYGVQCCGGEVGVLFEPLPVRPAVAIFGMGHVGQELGLILSRHDLDLHLIDSRRDQVEGLRIEDSIATVHRHHSPVPELALGEIPAGSHVLVMTHDHAEDAALCDTALRCGHLGSIGLIGSRAKWRRFEKLLAQQGHSPEQIGRIRCPIGVAMIRGKEPAVIAVSVAAELLSMFATATVEVQG